MDWNLENGRKDQQNKRQSDGRMMEAERTREDGSLRVIPLHGHRGTSCW